MTPDVQYHKHPDRLLSNIMLIQQQLDELELKLKDAEDLIAFAEQLNLDLEERCARLENENLAQAELIKRLQEALIRRNDVDCNDCSDRDTSQCPGKDLCGKRILYVGGMHKLVQHYRKMVEDRGGHFMHHDGGKEVAKSRLPRLIFKADAVICPIDCVSHDACLSVKKYCKQSQKPFLMMRGSGLSSLAQGLNRIAQ